MTVRWNVLTIWKGLRKFHKIDEVVAKRNLVCWRCASLSETVEASKKEVRLFVKMLSCPQIEERHSTPLQVYLK